MNLFELLVEISNQSRDIVEWVFFRDFSTLNKKLLGVSVIDLIGVYIGIYTVKELVFFFFKMWAKLFGAIFRNAYNYLGIRALLLLRAFWLRARATAIFLYEHDRTQQYLASISHTINTRFNRLTQRFKN